MPPLQPPLAFRMLRNAALADYAARLAARGFSIYIPRAAAPRYFMFSRPVEGVECFGTVSEGWLGSFEFSMPIRPSRENGSSMWVDSPEADALDLATAERVASPSNYNPLVGRQRNHADEHLLRIYYEPVRP